MKHFWFNEEKKYGFYLVGFFEKGRKAMFSIERYKPFEIDNVTGEVQSKCFHGFKRNSWASEWEFIEGFRISEIDNDIYLRSLINDIWEGWCKKHKRKYSPLYESSTQNKINSIEAKK